VTIYTYISKDKVDASSSHLHLVAGLAEEVDGLADEEDLFNIYTYIYKHIQYGFV
jgi:hypothetical protein